MLRDAETGRVQVQALFDQIGEFLERHRLGPEPINYEFAYRVLSSPDGPLARRVAELTEGGFRLTRKDIVNLGGEVASPEPEVQARALQEALAAKTQLQVEGFQDLMRSVRAETSGFGRDLEASASQMDNIAAGDIQSVRVLTDAMLQRVRQTEARLEDAHREAEELRQRLEEARDDATRDPLTSLPNRRALNEAFAEAAKEGKPRCLAVCDVDRFKLVNDSFGHAVGDRVLKAIGEALATTCSGHLVARFGGEEFAVLFNDLTLAEAQALLEQARVTVANKRYRLRETDAPLGSVTFSGGLITVASSESLEEAFARADALLYAAKNSGRNQIVASGIME